MERYPHELSQLEKRIGYVFCDRSKLELAMTHSSYSNELRAKGISCGCNERLEFLGDSVLSLVTARYLYELTPKLPEGDMSKVRAAAVCEKALHGFASSVGLGDYLLLGHGEELSHGRTRASILADAFEALLAAMYLDGGFEAAEKFLLPFIRGEVSEIISDGRLRDHKTALQQLIQQDRDELLEYRTVRESGPPHKRIFEVEAVLNGNVIGKGTGLSKRSAEQNAAMEALKLFGVE
ncbi:MAG: ribonuclease III [Firmicutes bacterium]|nr:ribonuclease III [Bacillota bacterium]